MNKHLYLQIKFIFYYLCLFKLMFESAKIHQYIFNHTIIKNPNYYLIKFIGYFI